MVAKPMTGMNELRTAVKALDNCRESFLDTYPAADLLNIWRAWRACDWDIYPDQWSARQLLEATTQRIVPRWTPDEQPDYSPATRKRFAS